LWSGETKISLATTNIVSYRTMRRRMLHASARGDARQRRCSAASCAPPRLRGAAREVFVSLLFDAPWWLPTTLAFIGIALFWNGNRRTDTKLRNVGLALLLAAVAVLAISHFVDTDLEKATKQSKKLVYAVEKRDWATLKAIMSPTTSLHVLGGTELYGTRDEIIAAAQKGVDQYGLKNVHIISTTPEQTDTVINITMTIMSEQDFTGGRPITTEWQFEWQESGATWSLVRITNVKIGNLRGDEAGKQFPRLR
jgi:hypothetical protein